MYSNEKVIRRLYIIVRSFNDIDMTPSSIMKNFEKIEGPSLTFFLASSLQHTNGTLPESMLEEVETLLETGTTGS
jgi:hypothetical protein